MRTTVHRSGCREAPLRSLMILALMLAALGAMLASSVRPASAATSYTIKDLGTLPGGSFSFPTDVNDAGQVVGYSQTQWGADEFGPFTTEHAFLWQNGQMRDLFAGTGGDYSSAEGINEAGQIAGTYDTEVGTYPEGDPRIAARPFLIQNGTLQKLGTVPGGQASDCHTNGTEASGINEAGRVVGTSGWARGDCQKGSSAFSWLNGGMQELGHLSGDQSTYGTAINDSGQVVGNSSQRIGTEFGDPVYAMHAFLGQNDQMQDLGTLPGGSYSFAEGINASGQVVGRAGLDDYDRGWEHAFLWQNGQMQELSSGYSGANDINDAGQAVGYVVGQVADVAVMWQNGTTTRLEDTLTAADRSDWNLSEATAINNEGQIVGTGRKWNGTRYEDSAFLLTPASLDTAKPTISGMSPKAGSVTRDTTPQIKATVRDNAPLAEADVRLYVAGKPVLATNYSYNPSTGALVHNSPKLPKGKKTVKIVATDAVGNVGAKSWSFTIK